MAKNRKTVREVFSYLQCDDFADYLSSMAAQGWHFKEWGAGLVFEKGEPEQAVYAVEVFYKGSDYDLTPSIEALDFADYCEKAGWQLVDAKQKYCIFKQIRPDAVPIVTPEERLKNASKAYRGQLIWQVVLSLLWIGNMLLHLLPKSQLINTLFSDFQLVTCAFWVYYSVCTVVKCIWYVVWVYKTKKRCATGETKILNQAKETLLYWVSNCILIALLGGQIAAVGPEALIIYLVITLLFLVPSLLFAKFRPDRETFIGFQIVMPLALCITIICVAICSIAVSDADATSLDQFPLVYEDLDDSPGEIEDTFHTSSSSIFGQTAYYSMQYENTSLSYELYETEHAWILDIVWDHNMWMEGTINGVVTDCAALWGAEAAFHNGRDYIVRYQDTILILRFLKVDLTEDHIAIIRDALGLEG